MTDPHFLLADTGELLTLRLSMPEKPLRAVLASIEALWPVVQPMTVHLATINPDGTANTALIGETSLSTSFPDHIPTTVVSTITQAVLADWMYQASGPFWMVVVQHARAWLDSSRENTDHIWLQDGAHTLQIPIEKRHDGLWVSGPTDEVLSAPIHYLFEEEWGWLCARIWISWGVYWTAKGTPGQQRIEHALRTMISQGWHPQSMPSQFNLG